MLFQCGRIPDVLDTSFLIDKKNTACPTLNPCYSVQVAIQIFHLVHQICVLLVHIIIVISTRDFLDYNAVLGPFKQMKEQGSEALYLVRSNSEFPRNGSRILRVDLLGVSQR